MKLRHSIMVRLKILSPAATDETLTDVLNEFLEGKPNGVIEVCGLPSKDTRQVATTHPAEYRLSGLDHVLSAMRLPHDFVEVQWKDGLLKRALAFLTPLEDEGPRGEGWKSQELETLIREIEDELKAHEQD